MYVAPSMEQRAKTLTIYGRKPVLEALSDPALDATTLHVADSNKPGGIIGNIYKLAETRGVRIRQHDRDSLSRISKNKKQDQGVALDISCPHFDPIEKLVTRAHDRDFRVLALDGITNPQNVGMIIRSAAAGGVDAIIYPRKGVAALGPLVIKASVGTVFRAPLSFCESLNDGLEQLKDAGFCIASLEGGAGESLFDYRPTCATVFVLGGETDGVSPSTSTLAGKRLYIPMRRGVESLNVAVAASLIAYAPNLR